MSAQKKTIQIDDQSIHKVDSIKFDHDINEEDVQGGAG